MLGRFKASFRRLQFLLIGVVALLAVGACTLNTSPTTQQQVTITGVPVVQIAAPQPNATYLEGVSVNIQALVTNAGPDIAKVEIAVDGTVVASPEKPNAAGGAAFSVSQPWTAAGAGQHTVTVTAYRANGSASAPASAVISVVSSVAVATEEPTAEVTESAGEQTGDNATSDSGDNTTGDASSNNSDQQNSEPTKKPKPTDEPKATDTPGKPVATFKQGVNVRRGPGTNFEPPIGAFAQGQTADITGVNPDKSWYKVRYYNADGWVFAQLVDVAGDLSGVPVDVGPATPVPVPPTAIPPTGVPATAVPQTSANLVAGIIRLDPGSPTCKQTFKVNIDIANLGGEDTSTAGSFTITDSSGESTSGSIPVIKKGKTVQSDDIPITVKKDQGKEHTLTIVLNPDSKVPETTHDDNTQSIKYTLQKSDSC